MAAYLILVRQVCPDIVHVVLENRKYQQIILCRCQKQKRVVDVDVGDDVAQLGCRCLQTQEAAPSLSPLQPSTASNILACILLLERFQPPNT